MSLSVRLFRVAKCCCYICLLLGLYASALFSSRLVTAQGNPPNPPMTLHLQNIPFSTALRIMNQMSGSALVLPPDIASQIDLNQRCSLDATESTLQDCLTSLLGQLNPPLSFHLENGKYVLNAAKGRPDGTAKPTKRTGIDVDLDNMPFDTAVDLLFQHGTNTDEHYRIDPHVTAFLDPVSLHVHNTTLDNALKQLLEAVPQQKRPLTFRKDKKNDIYLITCEGGRESSNNTQTAVEAIGLPSYHPVPTIQKVAAQNARLIVPLQEMFEQAKASYVLELPTGVVALPRVTFEMHDVPLEQAVVHLLRSAPTEFKLYFTALPDWRDTTETIPQTETVAVTDLNLNGRNSNVLRNNLRNKEITRLYLVKPNLKHLKGSGPFELADGYRVSYHFHDMNLYDALKSLLQGTTGNYTIDPNFRKIRITAIGSDLLLAKAIDRVVAASPVPMEARWTKNLLEIHSK